MKGTLGNRKPPAMLAGGRWRRSRKEVNRALDMAALLVEREAAACVRGLARWQDRAAHCLQFAEAVRAARGVSPAAGGVPSALDALAALLSPEWMEDGKPIERETGKGGPQG